VTTFNALRNAGLRAGALVAIQGVGGLGHLGIQFARRMGFKTVAIGLGPSLSSSLNSWVLTCTSTAPRKTLQPRCKD
jgi:D-arabinose 1-dehydrogenase-like Zn-dependent alcohol dehydrogenase